MTARLRVLLALAALTAALVAATAALGRDNATSAARAAASYPRQLVNGPQTPVPLADVPLGYERLYRDAGERFGVDWRLLAAVGSNETDHGRVNLPGVRAGVNAAGCCAGPMQLSVSHAADTFGAYAVDGDGDGVTDVYAPADAIYTAAHYVRWLRGVVGSKPALLLAAYNAGPGNVLEHGGVPPFAETRRYVSRGVAYAAAL